MSQVIAIQQQADFAEKVYEFSLGFLMCCYYVCESEHARDTFTKGLYAQMISSSKLLEDFLDFHGATNNSEWFYYRELVSSVRNLAAASYSQKHISIRLRFYELKDTERFEKDGYSTHKFLISSLRAICCRALEEARRLHIKFPKNRFVWTDFPGISTGIALKSDIDDENLAEEEKNIVKIATEFFRTARDFETHDFSESHDIDEIMAIVPSGFNEEKARRFEMTVHSLQSTFDTYINRSGLKFRNVKLKSLRGHISVVLHLLELTRCLLHYYERHLHEVGYKNIYNKVRDELTRAVKPEQLLDRIVNYGLYYVAHFFISGKELACELLNRYVERGRIVVGVPQKLGFHSRPSLLVAKIVQYYGGHVDLCVGDDRFDACSVPELQWAGGKIQKENIQQVVFEGDTRALNDIKILSSVNYGEDSMGKGIPLPRELSYLKQ